MIVYYGSYLEELLLQHLRCDLGLIGRRHGKVKFVVWTVFPRLLATMLCALSSLLVMGSALPAALDAAPPPAPTVVPAMLKHFELQTGRDVLLHDIGNFGSNIGELKVICSGGGVGGVIVVGGHTGRTLS